MQDAPEHQCWACSELQCNPATGEPMGQEYSSPSMAESTQLAILNLDAPTARDYELVTGARLAYLVHFWPGISWTEEKFLCDGIKTC